MYFAFRGNSPLYRLNYNQDNLINSVESLIDYLELGEDYSFQLHSRSIIGDKEYERYKQFYKGMEVEPGGFAISGGDPCDSPISLFVFSDIGEFEDPNIGKEDITDILKAPILESELVLVMAEDNCTFEQIWRVQHYRDEIMISWIDATDGTIIRTKSLADNASSYNISDVNVRLQTRLINQNRITSPEMTLVDGSGGTVSYYDAMCNEQLQDASSVLAIISDPVLTLNTACGAGHATLPTLVTNFAFVDACITNVGILLPPAVVIINECAIPDKAAAFPLNDPAGIVFQFGAQDIIDEGVYLPFYSTDVIAHEYGHHFLNQFFFSATSIDHLVIHEYFADLFSLYVNTEGCGMENDFTFNTLDGGIIRDFRDFDFNDPCQYEVDASTFDSGNPHFYASTFRYLAYQIVDKEIMTLTDFFNSSVAIMATFPDDGTVTDLALLYLDDIISKFGACSDETAFINELLESLCLTEQLFPCDVIEITYTTPTTQVTVEGVSLSVCENEHNGTISLSINSDNYNPDVVHSWDGIRPEWIVNGQLNNADVTGNEIVIQFPKYNFYPRKYTICNSVRSSGRKGCVSIILRDCDNNDPSCEEVFFDPEGIQNEILQSRTSQIPVESNNNFEVFDIAGKYVISGNLKTVLNKLNSMPTQLFIIMEYNKDKGYLQTYKYISQ